MKKRPARSIAWEKWLNSEEGRHYWGTLNPKANIDSPPEVSAFLYTEEERSRLWHVFMAGWRCANGTLKDTACDEVESHYSIENFARNDPPISTSGQVPFETRQNCVKRSKGVCEYCKKPLGMRAMRSDTFPCWKCGRKTTVEIGSETAEEPLQTAFLDESRTLETSYIMQHCSHCGAKLGDHFVNERLIDFPEEFYGTEFTYHLHRANFNGADHREENLMVVHPECHKQIHGLM